MLVSVGGMSRCRGDGEGGGVVEESGLSEEEELRGYDCKVYRAQVEMGKAAERELAGLGVPFFGVGGEGREEELRALRGRVVGFLEDLCGGEEEGEV